MSGLGLSVGSWSCPSRAGRRTTFPHPRCHCRGLTMIEVVVCIGILGILLAILLPAISSVRQHSIRLECLVNARMLFTYVSVYASDHADRPPSWIEPGVNYESTPTRWREFASQDFWAFEDDRWLDYTGMAASAGTLYCPANSWYPESDYSIAMPDYCITSSLYARPSYLDPGMPASGWQSTLGGGIQPLHRVRFPSAKTAVFEFFVYHGWNGRRCEGCENDAAGLEYHGADRAASVAFFDGRAELRQASEAVQPVYRYPIWNSYIYNTTPNGVLGRDFQ